MTEAGKLAVILHPVVEKPLWRWIAVGIIVPLILTVGGIAWWQPWKPSLEPVAIERMASVLSDEPFVAVPPLANESNDANQTYFSDGVSEDLTKSAGTGDAELSNANGSDVVRTTTNYHNTALYLAIRRGHKSLAEFLTSLGEHFSTMDAERVTPLHYAAVYGDIDTVQLLLVYKADINAQSAGGDYPGETPLHVAAYAGRIEIAELLLINGADIYATDQYSYTPLRRAVDNGHLAMAKLFIKNGADITARDNRGLTMLHVAAQAGHLAMAELLIAEGIDVNVMDGNGFMPLDYALGGEPTMVETLRRHGAVCTAC